MHARDGTPGWARGRRDPPRKRTSSRPGTWRGVLSRRTRRKIVSRQWVGLSSLHIHIDIDIVIVLSPSTHTHDGTMRTPSATFVYTIFVGCLLLLVFWRPPTGFDSLTVGYGSHFPATRVDLAEVLIRVPPGHETFAWARDDGNENGFVVLGTEAAFVEIDEAELIDARTGKPLVGANEGHTFNLAVLKLPHGSRWGFLGVARGPTRRRSLIVVNGHESREQVLVA
jgi:hypothetical protein